MPEYSKACAMTPNSIVNSARARPAGRRRPWPRKATLRGAGALSKLLLAVGVGLLNAGGQVHAQASATSPGASQMHAESASGQRSQVNLSDPAGAEYPFVNLIKSSPTMVYGDNSGNPGPDELDSN